MSTRKQPTLDWRETPAGRSKYVTAREKAQASANATGMDFGLEANDFTKDFFVRVLPRRENRQGFELRCEVVMCEDLSKCHPGHGAVQR